MAESVAIIVFAAVKELPNEKSGDPGMRSGAAVFSQTRG